MRKKLFDSKKVDLQEARGIIPEFVAINDYMSQLSRFLDDKHDDILSAMGEIDAYKLYYFANKGSA